MYDRTVLLLVELSQNCFMTSRAITELSKTDSKYNEVTEIYRFMSGRILSSYQNHFGEKINFSQLKLWASSFFTSSHSGTSLLARMGYTRVCTPILYPILYWTKTAEQYQYPIPIIYRSSIHNPCLAQVSLSLFKWHISGYSSLSFNVWQAALLIQSYIIYHCPCLTT